jgi:hemerythrin superfamily protein
MATKERPKSSTRSNGTGSGSSSGGGSSAFDWGGSQTGIIVGAAVAGAAVGLAANAGRKLFVQMTSGASGDWADALMTEHQLTLATFDKIEATSDKQTSARSALLAKLKYMLTKHALQEENVIYPALRQANLVHDADALDSEHGYVKTYLYELETLPKNSPEWLARVRDFRAMIEEHMRMEENEVFPALRQAMTDEQNGRITAMMNKEGFKFA